MLKCTLDYDHAPVWCDACWEDERRGKELKSREQYNKLLAEQNELIAAGLDERDRPRRRQYVPPPEPQIKPQPIVTERRGL